MRKTFLLFAITLGVFIAAASVPSPLYDIFQHQWHFSAITLTLVFAIYAFSLLVALLFVGALSDYIGRRPVLLSALTIEFVGMATFAFAKGVAWLFAARLLQGFATGTATAVVSAGLIDARPKDRPGLAPLVTTIVPVASLGVGAMTTSALVEYAPWPTHLVFWILCAALLALGLGVLRMPETAASKPGWRQAIAPILALPSAARRPFVIAGPSLVACWVITGFYLSLSPSVAIMLAHSANHLIGGLAIVAFTAAGALASLTLSHRTNRQLLATGGITAVVGLAITLLGGTIYSNIVLFYVGTAIAGMGFGPAFTGSFRSIMSKAPTDQRAGLAAIVYIVSYVAFGAPAVIAGIITATVSLHMATIIYGITTILLYASTLTLMVFNSSARTGQETSRP